MRTLIAGVVGLVGFALYVMVVVALADRVPAFWPVQALYFLAAGTLWVLPARWLMLWAAGMIGPTHLALPAPAALLEVDQHDEARAAGRAEV